MQNHKEGYEDAKDAFDNNGYTPSPLPEVGNENPPTPQALSYQEPETTPDTTPRILENVHIEIPIHQVYSERERERER